ncbi:hypothetical protein HYW19_01220 [Candidatus Woesearchaeota archaeon]|nr:hypothetical protein [Candidatus Woesearchaeota archaeon]
MFRALKDKGLEHEIEKLKMIVAISRRISSIYGRALEKTNRDFANGLRAYCREIEQIAFEDVSDLEAIKREQQFFEDEFAEIDRRVARLRLVIRKSK